MAGQVNVGRRRPSRVEGSSIRELDTEWAPAVAAEQEPSAGAERWIGHAAPLGRRGAAKTAVTHGRPRCLGDNENRSSTAVLAVMEPPDGRWRARCRPWVHGRVAAADWRSSMNYEPYDDQGRPPSAKT